MDKVPEMISTIGDQLPWAQMVLDHSERLAGITPPELLDWRPVDPSGRFCFSLGEILMHIADARLMFVRQLNGDSSTEGYWATSAGPNEYGAWEFRACSGLPEIIDSLKATREMIDDWLAQPESNLLTITDGARQTFEQHLDYYRNNDLDLTILLRRGAPTIMRVIMAVICHEAGHRGSLQTLLRINGVNLPAE